MMRRHMTMIALWVVLLLGVGAPPQGHTADRRPNPAVLVVMTINGQFLWDGVEPEEGAVTFPHKGAPDEAAEHMREVAALIRAANPDMVNLVEVENLTALTTFNTTFLPGQGYRPYLIDGTDTFTGQDVALLTRIDPDGETLHRDNRLGTSGTVRKAVSKHYIATFTVNETRLALIGLHLLAQPLALSRQREREAQADAIVQMARALAQQGHQLIVLGDFNDYDGAAESLDHVDSRPITTVLRHIRALEPADPADDLVNALSFVPKARRFTAFHDANENEQVDPPREFTAIDHILLSPMLAARVEAVEIAQAHDPRHVTDHFPVVVRLRFAPTSGGTGVRITGLLPNPPGDETQHEAATLTNTGAQAISLQGWTLRDRAQTTWALDALGTLQPGEAKTLTRQGQPMAMNNRGDTIELVSPQGQVVQSVTYQTATEGEVIVPASD